MTASIELSAQLTPTGTVMTDTQQAEADRAHALITAMRRLDAGATRATVLGDLYDSAIWVAIERGQVPMHVVDGPSYEDGREAGLKEGWKLGFTANVTQAMEQAASAALDLLERVLLDEDPEEAEAEELEARVADLERRAERIRPTDG